MVPPPKNDHRTRAVYARTLALSLPRLIIHGVSRHWGCTRVINVPAAFVVVRRDGGDGSRWSDHVFCRCPTSIEGDAAFAGDKINRRLHNACALIPTVIVFCTPLSNPARNGLPRSMSVVQYQLGITSARKSPKVDLGRVAHGIHRDILSHVHVPQVSHRLTCHSNVLFLSLQRTARSPATCYTHTALIDESIRLGSTGLQLPGVVGRLRRDVA